MALGKEALPVIKFLQFYRQYLLLALIIPAVAIYSVVRFGFSYSVEFVGGGSAVYSVLENPQNTPPKEAIARVVDGAEVHETNVLVDVTAKNLTKQTAQQIITKVKPLRLRLDQFDNVGPSVSADNIQRIVVAVLCAVVVMLIYIGFTFRGFAFAVAAVLAMIHDTLILLGSWAFLGLWGAQFDVLFITSVLTVMSFSVHDTIVIFDKIKEEERLGRFAAQEDQINSALTLTITRSINNSLTIILMLSALVLLGGGSIRWFATSLLIGSIVGTYSSPFVATPIYYLLSSRTATKRKK